MKARSFMISAITKRAKVIRKGTSMSWQAALKKAGAELRSTVKKAVKKAKPKKKATAKKKTSIKHKTTKYKIGNKKESN